MELFWFIITIGTIIFIVPDKVAMRAMLLLVVFIVGYFWSIETIWLLSLILFLALLRWCGNMLEIVEWSFAVFATLMLGHHTKLVLVPILANLHEYSQVSLIIVMVVSVIVALNPMKSVYIGVQESMRHDFQVMASVIFLVASSVIVILDMIYKQ